MVLVNIVMAIMQTSEMGVAASLDIGLCHFVCQITQPLWREEAYLT